MVQAWLGSVVQADMHKGKLAKVRDTALTVGEHICAMRDRAYLLAKERQARLHQQARLKRSLTKSMCEVEQEKEVQVWALTTFKFHGAEIVCRV